MADTVLKEHVSCPREKSEVARTLCSVLCFLTVSVTALHRYKERLETKYIKPRKLRGNSETLIGSSWTFLEKGGDDFRDGLPPEANYNYVKKVRGALTLDLVNLLRKCRVT